MGKVIGVYVWIFDDVSFAIDVREARKREQLTQLQLAVRAGYADGSCISSIERATKNGVSLSGFLNVCNALDLKPTEYFDLQKIGSKHER